ncbi:3-hydroxybenzoate 6-hydroxylase 1 [Beauveria bassiana]|uniref:3-hydroxybenzoate 6-hydroxylase 1 n=1 Tax=Beauveria bassiana TaxID=176275 RepID=A0A2N6NIY0_BEABA|nr:3-hydroxybenzoate 6-hydroxylase 1 [Beauveria bassiana]
MGSIREPLHLVVIGGGLAGLSAAIATRLEGHRCTLLEKAPEFHEVGAGLQLTPNSTRLLRRWGVLDKLRSKAGIPTQLTVRRYDGSKVLSRADGWDETMQSQYDAPFWDMHRADLQAAMVARARYLGVDVRTGAEVESIDTDAVAVTLAGTREKVQGHVVLAADGLWSRTRAALFPDLLVRAAAAPQPTGDLAYRIILRLENLQHDPELAAWVAKPTVNFWVGADAHAVAYSVRGGTELNLVLLCPDDLPEGCARAQADLEEMRARFQGWDPLHEETPKLTLFRGDSCHPMLPYLAQGANSAMEDGAVLGRLLGSIHEASRIPDVLAVYQEIRKVRVEKIARQALKQRYNFHMPDGPLQEARDEAMTTHQQREEEYPSQWTCPIMQPWLYGYDAIAVADSAVANTKL